MNLETEDVAVLGDYFGDKQSAFAAVGDYYTRLFQLLACLSSNPAGTKVAQDYSDFKVPVTGIIGDISGDVISSTLRRTTTSSRAAGVGRLSVRDTRQRFQVTLSRLLCDFQIMAINDSMEIYS